MELSKVMTQLEQIGDNIAAARSAVNGTIVRAPVSGAIVHAAATSLGGVINAGETIAEIVPDDNPLGVKIRVDPADINKVQPDQKVSVSVSSLDHRIYDELPGRISYVAADTTEDPRGGPPYFEATVLLNQAEIPRDVEKMLGSGLTAQVFVAGQSRTFLSYLLRPFTESFRRAFNEP